MPGRLTGVVAKMIDSSGLRFSAKGVIEDEKGRVSWSARRNLPFPVSPRRSGCSAGRTSRNLKISFGDVIDCFFSTNLITYFGAPSSNQNRHALTAHGVSKIYHLGEVKVQALEEHPVRGKAGGFSRHCGQLRKRKDHFAELAGLYRQAECRKNFRRRSGHGVAQFR